MEPREVRAESAVDAQPFAPKKKKKKKGKRGKEREIKSFLILPYNQSSRCEQQEESKLMMYTSAQASDEETDWADLCMSSNEALSIHELDDKSASQGSSPRDSCTRLMTLCASSSGPPQPRGLGWERISCQSCPAHFAAADDE